MPVLFSKKHKKMTLQEIIEQNYQVTRDRGLITDETNFWDFLEKIEEESGEFEMEILEHHETSETAMHELADIILVCFNYARHFGIDIEAQLIKNIENNKNRV